MADVNTLSLDDVPVRQRYQYFKFLIQNKVEFDHDETGNYVATVRIQNSPDRDKQSTRRPDSARKATQSSTNKTRKKVKILDKLKSEDRETLRQNLFKTKFVSNRSPGRGKSPLQTTTETPNLLNVEKHLTNKTPRQKKKIQPSERPDWNDPRFYSFISASNITENPRPKKFSFKVLHKNIEEIYSAKYRKDIEDSKAKRLKRVPFPDFVSSYIFGKYKQQTQRTQFTVDLWATLLHFEAENCQIRVFTQFLAEELSTEDLIFFLFLRSMISKELKIQLNMRFPQEWDMRNTRNYFLTEKQCRKITNAVLGKTQLMFQKIFIDNARQYFVQGPKEPVIPLYQFLESMVNSYHLNQQQLFDQTAIMANEQEDRFNESTIVAKEPDELEPDELEPDEIEPDEIERDELDTEELTPDELDEPEKVGQMTHGESLISFALTEYSSDDEDSIRVLYQATDDRDTADLRDRCLHGVAHLASAFLSCLMTGYEDLPDVDAMHMKLSESLLRKVTSLCDALFKNDKLRWLDIILDNSSEAQKYIEHLQWRVKELCRHLVTDQEVTELCKMILSTPQIRWELGRQLSSLTLKYTI